RGRLPGGLVAAPRAGSAAALGGEVAAALLGALLAALLLQRLLRDLLLELLGLLLTLHARSLRPVPDGQRKGRPVGRPFECASRTSLRPRCPVRADPSCAGRATPSSPCRGLPQDNEKRGRRPAPLQVSREREPQ